MTNILIYEDDSEHFVTINSYFTEKFCQRTIKIRNQLVVERLQEIQIPLVCRHINYKLYIVDNFSYIALRNSIYMFRY
ncbi:MAG: hypothetical protein DCC43_10295 [Candidatus Brocadia sp.]|nr:hypothetical protein [Candidatus Brocadia sp. AMX3]RIJ97508.1 MAG: hypothetical protein DCC43_10295 [Candidatus Brocadia sp.]